MLWFCILFLLAVRVNGEDAVLICDEYIIEGGGRIPNLYCTISGLQVTHSQKVVVDRKGNPINNVVEYMKFYDSSLLYIPPIIFDEFLTIKNLDISFSNIIEITRNTFTYASELLWLDASNNNISEITTSIFVGANKLQRITLNYNRIENLDEHSFNGLESLSRLYLTGNQIKNLHSNIFKDNLALERISLNKNKIQAIDPAVFGNLKNLLDVDLSDNRLLSIDSKTFQNALGMETILLSRNLLTNFSLELSVGPLVTLNLEENKLTHFYINCSSKIKHPKFESSCNSIEWLFLSKNNLSDIRNISNLLKLRVLDLSYNPIGKVNISTFAKLSALDTLRLKQTNLSGLTYGTFAKQTSLRILDLSDNNLQNFNLDIIMPCMTYLTDFFIDGNNLTEIQGKHGFESMRALKTVGLSENKFNCSYLAQLIPSPSLNPLLKFKDEYEDFLDDVPHIRGIACSHDKDSSQDHRFENVTKFPWQHYESSIEKMKLHEYQLEQHLTLMKFFVGTIAVLGLCAIIFKIIKLIPINRDSLINSISYRSTATIQTNIE